MLAKHAGFNVLIHMQFSWSCFQLFTPLFKLWLFPRQYEDFGTDWNWDGETITKANGFLFQLQSSSFLICFKILHEIFQNLRSLTIKLQMQAIDVVYAYKDVQSVISTLKGMRERSSSEFKNIFSEAQKLGKDL